MGIGEQFEFEKTGRIGPDPLSAFALQEIGKLRRQYTELACAVWCCPKEEFDGDHNSVVAEADRQGMLVVKQADEIERLRAFRDAVLSSITEHAGGGQEYAYIWQDRWEKIKAAEAAGGE